MGREAISMRPYARQATEILGHEIRHARVERGWTQNDLAERAGVTARTVSLIERGAPTPSIGHVLNCCAVAGVPLFDTNSSGLARLHAASSRIAALLPRRVRPAVIDNQF